MANETNLKTHAVKFIHASDFHLEKPISGLSEIPKHLKTQLANAPYDAAENVFSHAIAEQVDFLILSGDIVNLELGGPRTTAFLLGQFERLAEKKIPIYWCSGNVDQPDRWPAAVGLPDNVITFTSPLVEHITHRRNGKSIATIIGRGSDSRTKRGSAEFSVEPGTPFPIAVSCGRLESNSLSTQNIRYWALGGLHKRQVIEKPGTLAIYPGTVQGRAPREHGAHSCTLVRMDGNDKIKTQSLEVDSVRWLDQKINVAETTSEEDLRNVLVDRCLQIKAESQEQLALVRWSVSTTGDFKPDLRSSELRQETINWLRAEYGQASDGIWTVDFHVDAPKRLPSSWYEEDTILGDYLRALGRFQGDASIPLGLHDFLPATLQDDLLANLGRVEPESRDRILQEAALLGVESLGAGEEFDRD